MSTPEIIYLIPGEDIEGYPGMAWCESSAPSDHCDPDEAVKYVRADIHESALKRQGNAAKMGMDAAKKDASWREENAKRLLAESNPAALESERAANADLTGEVERLQARVAELEVELSKTIDDEDDAMNQVFFLAQSIQESPECIGIVKRKAGVESISVNLRDYLEDLGVLPVSKDRLFPSHGDGKAGGDA